MTLKVTESSQKHEYSRGSILCLAWVYTNDCYTSDYIWVFEKFFSVHTKIKNIKAIFVMHFT